MARRATSFFSVVLVLLALLLAACGDSGQVNESALENYPGSASLTVPDTFKTEMDLSLKNVKESHYEAYKTGDSLDKVKTFYKEELKKKGWEDKTGELVSGPKGVTEAPNSFAILYQKGNDAATVMGFSGDQAKTLGFSGINSNETFFLVLKGKR